MRARPRTQSSLAIRGGEGPWFLVNASPDARQQLETLTPNEAGAVRAPPVAGVLLTDAEIDHTLGLMLLREGRGVDLHCTKASHAVLRDGTGLLNALERYCPVRWSEVESILARVSALARAAALQTSGSP